jgi:hypothetical protein
MSDDVAVPLWRCVRDNSIINGVPYHEGQIIRSWNMPPDLGVTLQPVNATAKIIDAYNKRTFTHPLKPKSAMTSHGPFLPAVLVFGGSSTGCLVEGGEHDDMPRFKHSGVVLTFPGTYVTKYDEPANEAGAQLLEWWLQNRDRHRELDDAHAHSCWCALTDRLTLPKLPAREQSEVKLPPGFGKPSPRFVPHDARPDAPMVPSQPSSPIIRTRRLSETRAVQFSAIDPYRRR